MLRLITLFGLLAFVAAKSVLHPLPEPAENTKRETVAKPSRKTYSRRSYNDDDSPYNCIYLYDDYDQDGEELQTCEEDRNNYIGQQLSQVRSFEFTCDEPCFAVLWPHEIDDYSGEGPVILSSTVSPSDDLDRTSFEHVEVMIQDRCVEICDDYGLYGACTYVCRDQPIPSSFVGHVKSFRFLCGDDDCVVTFWEGPLRDTSYDHQEFRNTDSPAFNDVKEVYDVQNIEVEYYNRALFKQGKNPALGSSKSSKRKPKSRSRKGRRKGGKKAKTVPSYRY